LGEKREKKVVNTMSWRVSLHVPPWHDRDVEMVREGRQRRFYLKEKNHILIIFMQLYVKINK